MFINVQINNTWANLMSSDISREAFSIAAEDINDPKPVHMPNYQKS